MNYTASVRLFLIFVSLICPSLRASLAVPNEEAAPQNFLFHHFGLSGAFKTIPKDVQHGIVAHLRELIVGRFELDKPAKVFEGPTDVPSKYLRKVFFSSDDSLVAIKAARKTYLGQVDTEGTELSSIQEAEFACSTLRGISADNSMLLVSKGRKIYIGHLSKDRRIVSYIQLRVPLPKHFSKEDEYPPPGFCWRQGEDDYIWAPLDPRLSPEDAERRREIGRCSFVRSMKNRIDFASFMGNDIILVTLYREIYRLKKGHKEFERIGEFKCSHGYKHILSGAYIAFHPATSKIYFWSKRLCGIEVFDIVTRRCSQLLDSVAVGRTTGLQPFEVSKDGKYLVVKNFYYDENDESHDWLSIWDLSLCTCIGKIQLTGRISLPFTLSPDGAFVLVNSKSGARLYHRETGQLIALKNQTVKSEGAVKFNTAGTQFAVLSDNTLALWGFNPFWNELFTLYRGHLTIEQALFILLLREVKAKNLSLKAGLIDLCRDSEFIPENVYAYLSKVYHSFDEPLKRYVLILMRRSVDPSVSQ